MSGSSDPRRPAHDLASRPNPTASAGSSGATRPADPRDAIADPALRPRHSASSRLPPPADLQWVRARDLASHGGLLLAARLLGRERLNRARTGAAARAGVERLRETLATRSRRLAPPGAFGRSGRTGTDRPPITRGGG